MTSLVLILYLGLTATAVLGYPHPEGDEDAPAADSSGPPTSPPELIDDPSDEYDDYDSPEILSSGLEDNSNNETEIIPDAPAEIPEEVMDIEALKSMVYEFTNMTSGFNTADILTRLGVMEENVRKTTVKLNRDLERERQQFGQLNSLLIQIVEIRSKLTEFNGRMDALSAGIGNLGKHGLTSSSLTPFDISSGGRHTSWATLYRSRGHSGRTYELDFRTCSLHEDCCKNLSDLDNDSQSIHTHDTCVKMFKDRDCIGESREFYPGSSANHADFGSYNDVFSSGKPCNNSG